MFAQQQQELDSAEQGLEGDKAGGAGDSQEEVEGGGGDEAHVDDMDPEVLANSEPAPEIVKISGHYVYGGARAGSLHNVYVKVLFADGTSSGRGYVPCEPLEGTDVLRAYLKTKNGQKIAKYSSI